MLYDCSSPSAENANRPRKFEVDIVASRDLVRGFQRRLRTIVPVPTSELAIDILDDTSGIFSFLPERLKQSQQNNSKNNNNAENNNNNDNGKKPPETEEELHRALLDADRKHNQLQQQKAQLEHYQRGGKPTLSAYEKRRRNNNNTSSPTDARDGQRMNHSKDQHQQQQEQQTLKESLLEAIKLDEDANLTYTEKRKLYKQLMEHRHRSSSRGRSNSMMSQFGGGGGGPSFGNSNGLMPNAGTRPRSQSMRSVANSTGGASRMSGSNLSSVWARKISLMQSKKEAAEQRIKEAYREHTRELKNKFTPSSKAVARGKDEVIPVILERECNSRMRHLGTTRCYYYDTWRQHDDGSPLRDENYDYCDLTKSQQEELKQQEMAAREIKKPIDRSNIQSIMSDEKLIRQRLNSGTFGPMMVNNNNNNNNNNPGGSEEKVNDQKNSFKKRASVTSASQLIQQSNNNGGERSESENSGDDDDDESDLTTPPFAFSRLNLEKNDRNKLRNYNSNMSSGKLKSPAFAPMKEKSTSFHSHSSPPVKSNSKLSFNVSEQDSNQSDDLSMLPPAAVRRDNFNNAGGHFSSPPAPPPLMPQNISRFELYGDGNGGTRVIGLDPNREPQVNLRKFQKEFHHDPRPSWSMATPASPAAVETLMRRRDFAAITPTRPAHSYPIPYDEKRRHISPVCSSTARNNSNMHNNNSQKHHLAGGPKAYREPNPYFLTSRTNNHHHEVVENNWQVCYSVQ